MHFWPSNRGERQVTLTRTMTNSALCFAKNVLFEVIVGYSSIEAHTGGYTSTTQHTKMTDSLGTWIGPSRINILEVPIRAVLLNSTFASLLGVLRGGLHQQPPLPNLTVSCCTHLLVMKSYHQVESSLCSAISAGCRTL